MPVFDYQCEKCNAEFEIERPLGATGRVKCPACGSTKTAKVFGAAGIVFKGSGFHVTDYRDGKSGPEAKSATETITSDKGDGAAKPPADKPAKGKSENSGTKSAKKGP